MFKIIALLLVACAAVHSAPITIDSLKIRFKISARDLPDKDNVGKGDPYVEVFYTEDGKADEIKIGRTATLTDTANPDWGDVMEFDFVRSKRQRWVFRVYDHDNLREDDKLGQSYVDVADFVDKNGRLNSNLNKKGYLVLETLDPIVQPVVPAVLPGQVVQPGVGVLPVAQISPVVNANTPMKLKFKLSAKDLPDKDKVGATDPYVVLSFAEGASTKQTKFGETVVINDNNNPTWGETFEFMYDPTRQQKWFFEIRDSDYGDSDGVGKAWVEIADYIAKGQKITVNLSKKGTLTVESTEPVVAPVVQAVQQPAVVQPVQVAQPVLVQPVVAAITQAPIVVPAVVPQPVSSKLRFKLSARNLEDRDVLGTSDPYVKVYFKHGSEKEVLLGNTKKFDDKEDVDWPDVFDYTYNPSVNTNPQFHFLVLDEDSNRSDEELGSVYLDVAEYVSKGESMTLKLKQGTLTVTKA